MIIHEPIHNDYPKRIICLTEETAEWFYLLGEQHRIAGISVYTVRPEQAVAEKPKVCDFTGVNLEKIRAINPDLILGFSDVQAEVAKQLIKEGFNVFITNQRSVSEILDTMLLTAGLVGKTEVAEIMLQQFREKLSIMATKSSQSLKKPVVYFEEWYSPLISGIRWVSELIEVAGGVDCFAELSASASAKGRVIEDETEVIRRNPDIIIASWCGKRFIPSKINSRKGWDSINALRSGDVYEIDSTLILQPGPAALTDGLDRLHEIISHWQSNNP